MSANSLLYRNLTIQGNTLSQSFESALNFYSDGFNRLNIAEPVSLFDYKVSGSLNTNLWTQELGVGGTVEYVELDSSIDITAPAGQTVINQTYQYIPYQPGKVSEVLVTGVLVQDDPPVTDCAYRLGSFDSNVQKTTGLPDRGGDGHFFEFTDSTLYVVQRASNNTAPDFQTDTKVAKSSWNVDKLDGTGSSGITKTALEIAQGANIYAIIREWLGVGSVAMAVAIGGVLVVVHKFSNEFVNTSTYMKTATLPIRYEVDNSSGVSTASLKQICCNVNSIGGYTPKSLNNSFYELNVLISVIGTNYVLFALQLNSDYNRYTIKPKSFSFFSNAFNAGDSALLSLILDPTISNGTISYSPINSVDSSIKNSAINIGTISTGNPTVTGGTLVYRDFVNRQTISLDIEGVLQLPLTSNLDGTSRTLVFAINPLPGSINSPQTVNAILEWVEEY